MKTFVAIAAAMMAFGVASPSAVAYPHVPHRHPVAADFEAYSPGPAREKPAADGCIGLTAGTSAASCGATLTGGPSGGLN